jgi:hypothetical protein
MGPYKRPLSYSQGSIIQPLFHHNLHDCIDIRAHEDECVFYVGGRHDAFEVFVYFTMQSLLRKENLANCIALLLTTKVHSSAFLVPCVQYHQKYTQDLVRI